MEIFDLWDEAGRKSRSIFDRCDEDGRKSRSWDRSARRTSREVDGRAAGALADRSGARRGPPALPHSLLERPPRRSPHTGGVALGRLACVRAPPDCYAAPSAASRCPMIAPWRPRPRYQPSQHGRHRRDLLRLQHDRRSPNRFRTPYGHHHSNRRRPPPCHSPLPRNRHQPCSPSHHEQRRHNPHRLPHDHRGVRSVICSHLARLARSAARAVTRRTARPSREARRAGAVRSGLRCCGRVRKAG